MMRTGFHSGAIGKPCVASKLSDPYARISHITKGKDMTYQIRIETVSGQVKKVNLTTKGAALDFIKNYPKHLDKNVRVKLDCDLLSVSGYVSGVK